MYLGRSGAQDYSYRAFGLLRRSIGLDKVLFREQLDRFHIVDDFSEISPDVSIFAEIASPYPLPRSNRYLFAEEGGVRGLDSFEHKLVLVVRDNDGLVAFT